MKEQLNNLRRSRTKKMFGGVCGGIAKAFDIPVFIPRLIFILLFLQWGIGLLTYFILWFLIPIED